ncbi:copper chaperone PCu(A)C [Phaeovulum sp.]|uniref:copper chaperone PCu(A)C n=1 Tax=Phaeovulum sp. TaxID=2934796 RepID=UPI003562DF3A
MKSVKYLLAVGAVAFALPAFAQDVSVEGAYVMPLAGMEDSAALYMVIKNSNRDLVTLMGGMTDAAAGVDLYSTIWSNKGVPELAMQPEGINISGNAGLVLAPGGVLLALKDLKAPLNAGDMVTVTVKFAQGIELPVEAVVK